MPWALTPNLKCARPSRVRERKGYEAAGKQENRNKKTADFD